MSYLVAFSFAFFVALCCAVDYPNTLSLQRDKYTAYWNYDNETEKFFFKVKVKNVSGWIAFGVSRLLLPTKADRQWNLGMMEYYDILVGGIYDNRTIYFKVCNLCGTYRCSFTYSYNIFQNNTSEVVTLPFRLSRFPA